MLICLNRKERLIYILGTIFNITDSFGSELMNISKANFRKILSRTRKKIHSHMSMKCGLTNEDNPCNCKKMIIHLIDEKLIDPEKPEYYSGDARKINSLIQKKIENSKEAYYTRISEIFQEQPFYDKQDYTVWLRETIKSKKFKDIFYLN